MRATLLIIILLPLWSFLASAQNRAIRGTLKTAGGEPVAYASVTIKNDQQRILAFKTSDSHGSFTLVWRDTVDIVGLRVEINHLGYKKVSVPLVADQHHYDILMTEEAIDLAEVEVKSRPKINLRGDTLSYDVASFTKPEDRTIEDVLKRMPGVEVEENGQIKYNGKAISNFYVDGDDLLDDKYAIGTKTIPHAMVKDVEVMQNHQPLNVLQGKALSENVALNLKIRDEAKLKLTGQAKPGGGLPSQYDGELNTILFNKKYKMLNVGKANNVGTDLATDFTAFNQAGRRANAGNSRPGELLSSGTVGNPALPTNRYYFNNSGSLNANNLVNLRSGLQLKANVGLLLDNNDMEYNSTHDLYLADDTIRYSEVQQIDRSPFLVDISLNAQANKATYYLNNALKIGYSGETGHAALASNAMAMNQRISHRIRDFSNTLDYIPALRNGNILSVNWYLNHFNRPQALNIEPGIHADVLNEGHPFDAVSQHTETPTWFNTLAVGYRMPNGRIMQSYRLSTLSEWQQLLSLLRLTQHTGEQSAYVGSTDNNLHWQRHNAQFNTTYELRESRWEALLSLPLIWQRIAYKDAGFGLDETKERLLFNPFFRAKYMTTPEDYLSASYTYSNQMGNINGVYRGAVLTNYRSLQANDAALQEQHAHNVGLNYNFQRNISMLFMNAGISYTHAKANTIASNVQTDNISSTVLLPYENDVSTFTANAGISKYIFALGATAGLKSAWSTTRFNQFLNDELLPYNNVSFSLTPLFEARLWNRISLRYEGTGTWTTSKLVTGETTLRMPDRQISRYDQSVNLLYSPFPNTFLRLSGRHQYTSQAQAEDISYFFMDANIRYKLDPWNTDIELNLTNLANITAYETYSLSANQFGYSRYNLRGRMAVLKLAFNL
ncbi:TonB-dependent receptor [Parapedobacter sp. ISTM3]|uniref:TonB-dependent receptor n=1 Tax=Parapedobacter sp. ISTM3 TaxID=2800130 RepID=UPI0019046490|nr:TonB-dependent receptor [Parapedobacter sp. ISTM3]MBK1441534.1 TonB-dependent receptor [Parapedobacter sp. ISTM3]